MASRKSRRKSRKSRSKKDVASKKVGSKKVQKKISKKPRKVKGDGRRKSVLKGLSAKKNVSAMKRSGKGLFKPKKQSNALSDVTGTDKKIPRTEVTRRLWKYIKDEGLNDGRTIRTDAKLKKVFGGRSSIDMLKMGGYVSQHLSD
tara:strand:- start:650 stop:1084 length:435 start_codon:yes stop_codon:yes gene_type:complete